MLILQSPINTLLENQHISAPKHNICCYLSCRAPTSLEIIFQDIFIDSLAGTRHRERAHTLICSLINQFQTQMSFSLVNYSVLFSVV